LEVDPVIVSVEEDPLIALVAPIIFTAAVTHPAETVKTSGNIVNAYKDAVSLAANPSTTSVVDYAKEHPVASLAVAGAGALATKGLVTSVLNWQNTAAMKANTDATLKAINGSSSTDTITGSTSNGNDRVIQIVNQPQQRE